ncbi:hypothetical protein HDU67_009348, partial [Dinochytrium kinnereticum]
MEQTHRIRFQPGRNPAIRPVRLNFNKVEAYPKPLILYFTVYLLESLGGVVLRVLGFDKYHSREERFIGRRSGTEVPDITYWARFPRGAGGGLGGRGGEMEMEEEAFVHMFDEVDPFSISQGGRRGGGVTSAASAGGVKREPLPIVFFHGIGGGLFSYLGFIYRVLVENRQRAFFLVELPYVSMRLVDHVPSMQQTVAEVEDMLDHHGFSKAFFIGHSLGTAVTAWMMNNSKVVAGSVLLDPIVFKTYHPSLAY